jgi:hypothetical protein
MRALVVWFSTFCALAWPVAGLSQAIHKCTAPEGTAYQSEPCGTGASDVVIASAIPTDSVRAHRSNQRAESPALGPKRTAASGTRRVFWRTSIAIGMSDDEVLNLPSWGRPSAITRTRSNRVWHEEWLYRWRIGGTSRLLFANGRLTAVETGEADGDAATPVSLTLR